MIRVITLVATLFACYFALAAYLKDRHVETWPVGTKPVTLLRTGIAGLYNAPLWMSVSCASAEVFENDTSIGIVKAVFNHPDRQYIYRGQRWKLLEIRLDHDPGANAYRAIETCVHPN